MPETKFQKKYVVRLSADERDRLQTLVADLKIPSADVLKARILLHADVSAAGDGWTDGQIAKALSTTLLDRSSDASWGTYWLGSWRLLRVRLTKRIIGIVGIS